MSLIARESEIDVDDIKAKVSPSVASDALAHIEEAMHCLSSLLSPATGKANEVYRALSIAHMGLIEALND